MLRGAPRMARLTFVENLFSELSPIDEGSPSEELPVLLYSMFFPRCSTYMS